MSFNEQARLDSGCLRFRGGRRAPVSVRSIGLEVAVFLISQFTGIDLTSLLGSSDLTGRAAQTTIYLARAVLGSFQR